MSGKKRTILIAEDNPTNMKLIRDILSFQGYEIIEAYDGKTALHKINENKELINLILMDLQLPEMDGFEIIKQVKSDPETQNLTIFVVSAHAMENDINSAIEAGCDTFITKPINIQDFLGKINAFFN